MDPKLIDHYNRLKEKGLTPAQERKILAELESAGAHDLPDGGEGGSFESFRKFQNIYNYADLSFLQGIVALQNEDGRATGQIVRTGQFSQQSETGRARLHEFCLGRIIDPVAFIRIAWLQRRHIRWRESAF